MFLIKQETTLLLNQCTFQVEYNVHQRLWWKWNSKWPFSTRFGHFRSRDKIWGNTVLWYRVVSGNMMCTLGFQGNQGVFHTNIQQKQSLTPLLCTRLTQDIINVTHQWKENSLVKYHYKEMSRSICFAKLFTFIKYTFCRNCTHSITSMFFWTEL